MTHLSGLDDDGMQNLNTSIPQRDGDNNIWTKM